MRTAEELQTRLEKIIHWFNVIPDDETEPEDDSEEIWEEEPNIAEGEMRALAWALAIPMTEIYKRLPVAEGPDPQARRRRAHRKGNGH